MSLADASPPSGGCSRRRCRRRRIPCWSRTAPAALALLLKLADAIDEAEAFAALEALNCGKPRIRVLQDDAGDCRLLPLLRRRRRNMHGLVAGEYMAGHTSMDQAAIRSA